MATRSEERPAPWAPPYGPPALPHDLCCHPQPPAAWSPGKPNKALVERQIWTGVSFYSPCVHLVEGPQKLRVRHHDNGERQSKAEQQVYDNVGHVPHISAVPVRSTGGSDPLKVKTTPPKERGCIPHKRPDPGEHHPGNSMSEKGRNQSWAGGPKGSNIPYEQ